MKDYRFQIAEAIDSLDKIEGILFTRMINIASEGELKEISDVFEINDIVPFKFEDLQNLQDPNISLLKNIFNKMVLGKKKL